jgi:hypothetical protein
MNINEIDNLPISPDVPSRFPFAFELIAAQRAHVLSIDTLDTDADADDHRIVADALDLYATLVRIQGAYFDRAREIIYSMCIDTAPAELSFVENYDPESICSPIVSAILYLMR